MQVDTVVGSYTEYSSTDKTEQLESKTNMHGLWILDYGWMSVVLWGRIRVGSVGSVGSIEYPYVNFPWFQWILLHLSMSLSAYGPGCQTAYLHNIETGNLNK